MSSAQIWVAKKKATALIDMYGVDFLPPLIPPSKFRLLVFLLRGVFGGVSLEVIVSVWHKQEAAFSSPRLCGV